MKDVPELPQKYPKKIPVGPKMDYFDSRLALPKSGKRQKKGKK